MKRKALFKFTRFSHKQRVVLEWWMPGSPYEDKDGIICDGSIRSGKTTVTLMIGGTAFVIHGWTL